MVMALIAVKRKCPVLRYFSLLELGLNLNEILSSMTCVMSTLNVCIMISFGCQLVSVIQVRINEFLHHFLLNYIYRTF